MANLSSFYTSSPLITANAVSTLTANNANYLGGSAANTYAPKASPTFTGTVTTANLSATGIVSITGNTTTANLSITGSLNSNGNFVTNIVTVSASNIDCSLGTYFIKTASANLTWTVSNVPASVAYSFLLELTNGGTGTQTWMSGIKWPGGTAPTLASSGVDVLGFITDDGGTTWRGVQLMKDSK